MNVRKGTRDQKHFRTGTLHVSFNGSLAVKTIDSLGATDKYYVGMTVSLKFHSRSS